MILNFKFIKTLCDASQTYFFFFFAIQTQIFPVLTLPKQQEKRKK